MNIKTGLMPVKVEWIKLGLLQFKKAEKIFYNTSTSDSPAVIRRYVESGLKLADACRIAGNSQMQEKHLLEVFSGLHAAVSNPLRHILFRYDCLSEINQPLEALSTLYEGDPEGRLKLIKVTQVMTKTGLKMFNSMNETGGNYQ